MTDKNNPITCFQAYDLRGQLETELNEDVAYRVGRAYAEVLGAETVVIGGDARATSEALKTACANGIMDAGADVIDIGMVGTEEIYFATAFLKCSGGIEVTASHNPMDYNGMKFVREESRPISGDTGLKDIKALAESEAWKYTGEPGQLTNTSLLLPLVIAIQFLLTLSLSYLVATFHVTFRDTQHLLSVLLLLYGSQRLDS